MSNDENGWSEYSKLVLKELETLARGIASLKSEIGAIKHELTVTKQHSNRIDELQEWKRRVDDVTSPTQLKELIVMIGELQSFKTRAITIFAVVQFLMGFTLFAQQIWG